MYVVSKEDKKFKDNFLMESLFLWSRKDKGFSRHDTISFIIYLV